MLYTDDTHLYIKIEIREIKRERRTSPHTTMSSGMMFNKNQAIQVLNHNNMDIDKIIRYLVEKPNHVIRYVDENDTEWSFTVRRRCHLFLMAKTQFMKKYEAVYSSPK